MNSLSSPQSDETVNTTDELVSHFVDVLGCKLHYVEQGVAKEDNYTMVFMHGFPEYWGTWREQLNYFGLQHHVIAPDLPGYNLSEKPTDKAFYQVPNLIKVFASFIKAVAHHRKVILVAHDWGGAIAWPLAAFHQDLVDKLVILNAAHPSTFTREMINNAEQRKRSDYIHELISKDAEQLLSSNRYQYLQDKIFATMAPHVVNEQLRAQYIAKWQIPGVVNGMLNYYRAMPQLAPSETISKSDSGPVVETENMSIPNIIVKVPTMVLWGEQDQAFVNENIAGLEHYVPNLKVKRFPTATHWLTHEVSEQVNQEIAKFLNVLP